MNLNGSTWARNLANGEQTSGPTRATPEGANGIKYQQEGVPGRAFSLEAAVTHIPRGGDRYDGRNKIGKAPGPFLTIVDRAGNEKKKIRGPPGSTETGGAGRGAGGQKPVACSCPRRSAPRQFQGRGARRSNKGRPGAAPTPGP